MATYGHLMTRQMNHGLIAAWNEFQWATYTSSLVKYMCAVHKTLVVMALVVCIALSPVVVHFIAVRAVVRADVRHIAYPSAFIFRYSAGLLSLMFDTDPLCLSGRNQWYSIDAAVDESLRSGCCCPKVQEYSYATARAKPKGNTSPVARTVWR